MKSVDLQKAIEGALQRDLTVKTVIAVHSEKQAERAARQAERLAKKIGGNPRLVEFEVIPRDCRNVFPVGKILEP